MFPNVILCKSKAGYCNNSDAVDPNTNDEGVKQRHQGHKTNSSILCQSGPKREGNNQTNEADKVQVKYKFKNTGRSYRRETTENKKG